jgi:hypothetical protein
MKAVRLTALILAAVLIGCGGKARARDLAICRLQTEGPGLSSNGNENLGLMLRGWSEQDAVKGAVDILVSRESLRLAIAESLGRLHPPPRRK